MPRAARIGLAGLGVWLGTVWLGLGLTWQWLVVAITLGLTVLPAALLWLAAVLLLATATALYLQGHTLSASAAAAYALGTALAATVGEIDERIEGTSRPWHVAVVFGACAPIWIGLGLSTAFLLALVQPSTPLVATAGALAFPVAIGCVLIRRLRPTAPLSPTAGGAIGALLWVAWLHARTSTPSLLPAVDAPGALDAFIALTAPDVANGANPVSALLLGLGQISQLGNLGLLAPFAMLLAGLLAALSYLVAVILLQVGPVGALGALGAAVFWLSPLVPGQPAHEFAFGSNLVALWLLLIALSLACWRRGHVTLGLVCGGFSVPAFVASLLTAVSSSSPTVSSSPGALVRALLFAGGGVALTLGTAAIAQRLAQLRPEAAPALASTLLLFVMAGVHLPIVTPSAESAISPALLDLGRRTTEQIGEGEVAYAVTSPAIAEWFERAALGRQRTPQLTTYDRWLGDRNGPEFLLLTSQPPTDAGTEVLLRSPNATLLRREAETMAGAPVSDARYPRVIPLGDGPQLVLVGFDVGERYEPGDVIRVTAHLAVNPRGLGRYRLTIRLIGRDGRAYGESEQQVSLARSPGRQITRVQFDVPAAGNAPGGLYDLELTVARQPSGELLTPLDGAAKDDRIALGMVRVIRQGEAGSQVTATPPQPLRATFTNGLTLYGYGLSQREVRAGAAVTLDLYWLPERQIDRDYAIVVFFLDQNDHVLATDELQPLLGRYPTTAWLPGERVRDQRRLRVPENLPESSIRLALGVVEPVSRVYDHDVTSGQSVIPFAPLVVEPAE